MLVRDAKVVDVTLIRPQRLREASYIRALIRSGRERCIIVVEDYLQNISITIINDVRVDDQTSLRYKVYNVYGYHAAGECYCGICVEPKLFI